MYSFYSVTTMTTISKGSCDVKIYWLTQTMKRDVYAMMQKYYFVFYPYIFTRSQYIQWLCDQQVLQSTYCVIIA